MSPSNDDTWRPYIAADAGVGEARERLEATGDFRPVRRALSAGPADDFRVAVDYVTRYRPEPLVTSSLDVLARLAVEGGAEQGAVREVLRTAPRADVLAVLPALVDDIVGGGGHDPYLEFAGLLSLLEEYGAGDLRAEVLAAARASADPDVRELADGFPETPPVTRRPPAVAAPVVDGPPSPAWQAYVQAWYRLASARRNLLESDWRAGFAYAASEPGWRPAVARFAAAVQSDAVATVLRGVDPTVWPQLRGLITAEVLTDPRSRVERYLSWLGTLTAMGDQGGLAEAIAAGKATADPKVQAVAHTHLG